MPPLCRRKANFLRELESKLKVHRGAILCHGNLNLSDQRAGMEKVQTMTGGPLKRVCFRICGRSTDNALLCSTLSNIARDSRTYNCQKICVDGPNSYQSLLSEGRIRDCRRDELRRSRHGQTEPGPSKTMDLLSPSTRNFGWCFSFLRIRRVFGQISSAGFCHLGKIMYWKQIMDTDVGHEVFDLGSHVSAEGAITGIKTL
ncbi:uncharacterized protein CLUP02_08943 [Colletotrichum lupini]|uniref:Uncharacterized protein n=1 Tax=Colletotrichum lupini TaxID=145971 RepID=A0A9Q8SUG3_9PEZI|nr:uncharacterized protein CLUP02_08943 [Colletotrichum lupini]KAK1712878.1 hypothetical protein BDP67DRAFT_517091 [Colletotrichum lupini]UQC83448.1 hypothetical protein CLUP02_08943 [Colletotrichum lupini]